VLFFRISDIETKIIFESGGKAVVISEIEKLKIKGKGRSTKYVPLVGD
jgi:hypothetical protein